MDALNPYNHPVATDDHRETGTVKWFNITKGFGFITRDRGDDVFVHYRAIRGEGHRTLTEGQRVDFVVVKNNKGLQAEDVIAAARGR
ncbi:cold-shock protein [Endozoicomonas sp. Mp262]